MSKSLQVASSEPVAKAYPFGKNYGRAHSQLVTPFHPGIHCEVNLSSRQRWSNGGAKNYSYCIFDKFANNRLTVTAFMSLSWPGKVCLQDPSRMSHNFALASHAPDTKVRVSGARDKDITSPVCPMKDVHCCPVSMSHRALSQNNLAFQYEALDSLRDCTWPMEGIWDEEYERTRLSSRISTYFYQSYISIL